MSSLSVNQKYKFLSAPVLVFLRTVHVNCNIIQDHFVARFS